MTQPKSGIQSVSRLPGLLYAIAIAAWLVVILSSLGMWQQTRTLSNDAMVSNGGHAYVATPPRGRFSRHFFAHRPDLNGSPAASSLVMLEDGRSFGIPHSDHGAVREIGLGRYSDWGSVTGENVIVFSTPDNTDPRTNGRAYSITYPMQPRWISVLLATFFGLFAVSVFLIGHGAALVLRARRAIHSRNVRRFLIVASYLVGAVTLLLSFGVWRQTDSLAPSAMNSIGGFANYYQFPNERLSPTIFGRQTDTNDSPNESRLVLFENGRPVGAPHSNHADIQQLGQGRYSHWGAAGSPDVVIFSTPDNTSPLSNQRAYTVEYSMEPGWAARLSALLLCIASTAVLYRSNAGNNRVRTTLLSLAQTRWWILPVLVAAGYVVGIYAVTMPAVPLLEPDSVSYLNGLVIVPLGYLYFASIVAATTGSLAALPAFQISIWACSVVTVYIALAKTLRFRFIAGLVSISLLLLGTATKYAMFAVTESVFMSTLILHFAAVLLALEKATRSRLLVIGVTAFLAAFLRPAGYFVPACTLALLLILPTYRLRVIQFVLAPMAFLFLASGIASSIQRGVVAQSLFGLALFPYVATMFHADFVPELQPASGEVERALAGYRAEWSTQKNLSDRVHFEMDNFNKASLSAQIALKQQGINTTAAVNEAFATFALATLRERPREYVWQVITHSYFAWSTLFYPIKTSAWIKHIYEDAEPSHNEFVDAVHSFTVPKYRYEDLASAERSPDADTSAIDYIPNALVAIPYLGQALGLFATILILAGLFYGGRLHELRPAFYIALMMHGAIVLITSTTIVISRYLDPVAPLALILIAILVDGLGSRLFRADDGHVKSPQ